jgi:hypothetical protein
VAGKKFTTGAGKRLSAYGEGRIFDLYLKYRDVRKMLKNLPPSVGAMSNGPFYEWLKADPTQGRWNRWQDVKAIIASDLVDGTVPAARLRSDYRRWIAERYDRESFGKTDISMVIGISADQEFLVALKAVEEKAKAKREEIQEADYEIVEDK